MAINKRKILESAQKHLQRGALDKALEDYRTLLKADPHDSNVLLKVGDLYLKQGKRDEAINAYLRVAQQFTRDGFDAKAVALYKQISRLDPKRHDVSVPLADLYARMGLVPDAIAALQAAADAAYRAGDKDDALELLRRMAALDPANTQNRLKVAELFAKEGRKQEAIAEYQAVADELERRGEDEERIRTLERMLACDPDRAPALLAVARAKLAASQFAAARKLAERLLAGQPEDIEGREILGHALAGDGEVERSRDTFRELAELYRLRGDEGRARDLMQRFGGLEALAPDESDNPLEGTDVPVLELEAELPEEDFLLDAEPLGAPEPKPPPPPPPVARPRAETTNVETPKREKPKFAEKPKVVEKPKPIEKPKPVEKPRVAVPPPRPVAAAVEAPAASAELESADPDQLLAEATVYLRYGKNERAVGALRAILAQEPGHRGALESLGEALAASGETAHALTAWQRAAEAARAAGDKDVVQRIRDRMANVDPAAAAAFAPPARPAPAAPSAPADAGDEVEIDIDLGGSLEAIEDPTLSATPELEDALDIDGLEPLDADELEESAAPEAEMKSYGPSLTGDSPTATTSARVAGDLEEAEFYFEQGLLDEARALYERILAAAPNHPQAMLRLGEVAARSGAPSPSAPVAVPASLPRAPATPPVAPIEIDVAPRVAPIEIDVAPPVAPIEIDDAPPEVEIDFGGDLDLPAPDEPPPSPAPAPLLELEMDLEVEEPPPPPVAPPARPAAPPQGVAPPPPPPPAPHVQAETTAPSLTGAPMVESGDFDLAAALGGDEPAVRTLAGTEEEAFEQVFAAFKTGVERELGEGDHEARYDLGIAYKEMGLLEDAIEAFQLAMSAPERKLACLHMLGLCALDLGRTADAVAHLEQALSLPNLPSEQRVPLRYDVGRAYAAQGDVARARAAFEEVRKADPEFGDVAAELAALAKGPKRPPAGAQSGEAYESFDDLLAETPAPATAPRYESFDDLFGDDADERPEPDAEPEPSEPEPEAEAAPEPPPPAPAAREAEAEEPQQAPAPAEPAAPRRKRKISFV